jgi:hypothetical protein
MSVELGILDILEIYGFDRQIKSKMVRHQDSRYDVAELIRDGWFELYQSLQARPIFKNCHQVVSLVGDPCVLSAMYVSEC